MTKTVMLIGGGVQEVRAIEFARRLDYRTLVTDRNPDAPCALVADESYVVDGHDTEVLVALASKLRSDGQLDGVFTLTELVTSVALVAEAAGLPGASVRSAMMCQDKGWAKREWLQRSIETPAGGVVGRRQEAHEILEGMEGSAILKPVEGFGGIGVARVATPKDVDRYFDSVAGAGASPRAWVMEEFLAGSSHDVNGLFDSEGVFHAQGIADRAFVPGTFAEHEVVAPTRLGVDQQSALYDLLRRCAEALGIGSGPVKGDAILGDDGFRMLEIAPRLHGPKMSLFALPESGQNHWPDFLSVITGGPVVGPAPDAVTRYFASRSIPCPPGRITEIHGADAVRALEGVVEVMLFRGPGDLVEPTRNSTDVVGYVLAATASAETTQELLDRSLQQIAVRVE